MGKIQNMKSTKISILACYGLIGLIVLMVIAIVSKMSSAVSAISDVSTQNISVTTITFCSSLIICVLFISALIHGLGFRFFTIYNKESRPQMSWRMLIQLVTNIVSTGILWCIEYLYSHSSDNLVDLNFFIFHSAWFMVGFILLIVLIFFIVMSVTTKILLPIDFITSIKSSILNLIVLLVLAAPLIYIYSVMGGAQSKLNSQMQMDKGVKSGIEQAETSKNINIPATTDNGSNAYAELTNYGTDDYGNLFFYDKSTIKRNGDKVQVWTCINYAQDTYEKSLNIGSMRSLDEIDCVNETRESLTLHLYTKSDLKGDFRDATASASNLLLDISPNSINATLMKLVCKK